MGFPREKPAHLQVFMTDYDFEQDGLGENAYLSGFTGSGNPCGGNSHAACFKIKRRLQWAQLHKGNILYNAPRCAEVKFAMTGQLGFPAAVRLLCNEVCCVMALCQT